MLQTMLLLKLMLMPWQMWAVKFTNKIIKAFWLPGDQKCSCVRGTIYLLFSFQLLHLNVFGTQELLVSQNQEPKLVYYCFSYNTNGKFAIKSMNSMKTLNVGNSILGFTKFFKIIFTALTTQQYIQKRYSVLFYSWSPFYFYFNAFI